MNTSKLNFNSFGEGFPDAKGIYYIIGVDKVGNVIPINRICGTDTDGVLYIGESGCIQDRIGYFIKTILPNYKTDCHSGGKMYCCSEPIRIMFPKENLLVKYELCEDHVERELELIQNYIQKFGELPPLNSQS